VKQIKRPAPLDDLFMIYMYHFGSCNWHVRLAATWEGEHNLM